MVYRIPGEKLPRLLTQAEEEIRLIYDLQELNGQKGFVIAPFRVSEMCPVVLIQSDGWGQSFLLTMIRRKNMRLLCKYKSKKIFRPLTRRSMPTVFKHLSMPYVTGLLTSWYFPGVLRWIKGRTFSLSSVFRAACKRYIHSYIYLCYTPQTGIWLGSTPEIILSGEKDEWNTVALAGTQPLQDGKLPQVWDEKNRKEQDYVTAYIRSRLLSLGIHSTESGPYPAYAGALSHLKTDFHFSLRDNNGLGDLLKVLHPTPAVCGLPKEEAYRFILENEGV